MYNYLYGKVVSKTANSVIIDVNNIGYELICSNFTLNSLFVDVECKIYTYMNVREDGITLFGFSTKEEKAFFNKLINVSGVGPKSAIGILSGDLLEHIIYCISCGDANALSKIKGLGKKTAEKIIVELRDKVTCNNTEPVISGEKADNSNDAVAGLMSLGFTKIEAEEGIKAAIADGAKDLQQIINIAIKRML